MSILKIHQRHMLKTKDIKKLKNTLLEQISENNINTLISNKSAVEWIKLSNREELIAIDGTLCFWFHTFQNNEKYIPLLSLLLNPDITYEMKAVSVDQGAIPHVTNGANVMRPGITQIDPKIRKNDIIKIQDFKHGRPLAIGIALFDADEMESKQTGKVIENIHTINDKIWKFSKEKIK